MQKLVPRLPGHRQRRELSFRVSLSPASVPFGYTSPLSPTAIDAPSWPPLDVDAERKRFRGESTSERRLANADVPWKAIRQYQARREVSLRVRQALPAGCRAPFGRLRLSPDGSPGDSGASRRTPGSRSIVYFSPCTSCSFGVERSVSARVWPGKARPPTSERNCERIKGLGRKCHPSFNTSIPSE